MTTKWPWDTCHIALTIWLSMRKPHYVWKVCGYQRGKPKDRNTIYKTLYRKLKIKQPEPHLKTRVNASAQVFTRMLISSCSTAAALLIWFGLDVKSTQKSLFLTFKRLTLYYIASHIIWKRIRISQSIMSYKLYYYFKHILLSNKYRQRIRHKL